MKYEGVDVKMKKHSPTWRRLLAAAAALTLTAMQCMLLPAGAAAQSESEGNDTRTTANVLELGTDMTGVSDGSDPDYYQLSLTEAATLQIGLSIASTVSTNDSTSYWTVQLMNSTGSVMAELKITGEILTYSMLPVGLDAGTYYIKVEGGYYHSDVQYTLHTSTLSGAWESERNDTEKTADAVAFNAPVSGRLQSSDDVDYYVFTLEQNGHITLDFDITETRDSTSEYWDVALISSLDGSTLQSFRVTAEDTENTLGEFGLDPGTYYVKVEKPYYYTDQVYSLTVSSDDEVWESEYNEDTENADVLTSGVPMRGRFLSSSDIDYYTFTLEEDSKVDLAFAADMTSTSTSDYWNIRVYDESQGIVAEYTLEGNVRKTDLEPLGLSAGTYFISVGSPYYWSNLPYTLTPVFTPDSNWEAEDNDQFSRATALNLGGETYGRLQEQSDEDYYSFTLEEDAPLDLTFSFKKSLNSTSNYFKVTLLTGQHEEIRTYEIHGDEPTKELDTTGLNAGDYLLRVAYGGYYWTGQSYTIASATDLHTDWESEMNDTQEEADVIDELTGQIHGCLHAQADEDWFRFTLGGNYKVAPVFKQDTPAANSTSNYWKVTLYDENGVLGEETGIQGKDLNTALGQYSLGAGTYYVKVVYGGYYYTTQPYTIDLNAEEQTYQLGDVNEDGSVNANDAAKVLMAAARIGAKKDSGLTATQTLAANVDRRSDAINANDASFILRYAAYKGAKGTDDIETYFGYNK
ncbi:MAG: hypothetical protein IJ055_00035 [Oscillospiraceae bacterium]|nr:hypothetical protein [Oscillospiraceae bacterium]